ncbi:SAM-dependent methyltransferase [Vibrio nigripulchritudo]|uniref:class I SAM-dependent methyltransferase n=1 Tax=Vibrio nigripulchritudo TaxID=28173 RepID=UPI00190A33D0|nr:class I SAM-dependent methyltransferase [Vibrio nigripulchritudo]BCL73605.1 SAM-dependent methyltransferase [Vibrio nigripulchritudo]BDU34973.1 SAM-dependent methyltransferase [Vibrio nigripulchritudo]
MKFDMYTKHAKEYAKAVENNIYNANFERPSTLALVGDVTGKVVLDLGCGSGEYADHFLKAGAANVTCVDLSSEMIQLVQSRFGEKVRAYAQDLSLGLPQEKAASVDVIVCPLMVHYLKDLSAFFKECARVLKPTGVLVFSTHHPMVDFSESPSGDYFQCELIEEEWHTLSQPVEVSFYRRSLTESFAAITQSGLVVSQFTEGQVTEKVKEMSPDRYHRLKTKPQFMFIQCQHRQSLVQS